jgi:MtrB/PioB family decaheme-associated outer membrane protein
MKTNLTSLATRVSVVAVRGALVSLTMLASVQAAGLDPSDPAVAELVNQTSTATAGIGYVSDNSAKFGEYNGLNRKGNYLFFDIDVRGGTRFDDENPMRWGLTAFSNGSNNNAFGVEIGKPGTFRLTAGATEFRRNRADTYFTPYSGVGTNVLTLPSNWIVPVVPRVNATAPNARGLDPAVTSSSALITGVLTAPTPAQLATAATLQATDIPAFQQAYLYTERKAFDLGALVNITNRWTLATTYKTESRDGAKPMGTVTRFVGGDISTIIADPIHQKTDQLQTTLGYTGDTYFAQASYYASIFTNEVPFVQWSNWATAGGSNVSKMSSAPDNMFHQFSLTASMALPAATRLTANASYGRNVQNTSYLTDTSTPLVPVSSLHGLVVSKNVGLKLTSRPVHGLNLVASYKFDERDNRTPVNIYGFYDANEVAGAANANTAWTTAFGLPATALRSNININENRPYSKRLNAFNLEADYAITKAQNIKGGFEAVNINRWCDGNWISCIDAAKTKENTVSGEWRYHGSDVSGRIGLAHGKRTVDNYNENAFLALVPMANVVPTGATASAYATMLALGFNGYGPALGLPTTPLTGNQLFFFANNNALANANYANANRISELLGMRRYNMADRDRNKVRGSVNWQAAETLSFQAGVDAVKDKYDNSTYGLQSAKNWALNLDATYSPTEDLTATVFFTHEDQRSVSAGNTYTANSTAVNVNTFTAISGGCFATIALRNASNKIDPCTNWSTEMRDKIDTFGLAVKEKRVFKTKVNLSGDVTFSQAKSDQSFTGGSYANNPLAVAGAPVGTIAAYYIPAVAMPTVKTDTISVRINGSYPLSKAASVRAGVQYGHTKAVDWAYDGMQYGGLASVLPSLEKAPNYTVHVIAVGYSYTFQ